MRSREPPEALHHGHPERATCAACGAVGWRDNFEVRTVVGRPGLVCPDCQAWDDA